MVSFARFSTKTPSFKPEQSERCYLMKRRGSGGERAYGTSSHSEQALRSTLQTGVPRL